jgi:hypothetical protein
MTCRKIAADSIAISGYKDLRRTAFDLFARIPEHHFWDVLESS